MYNYIDNGPFLDFLEGNVARLKSAQTGKTVLAAVALVVTAYAVVMTIRAHQHKREAKELRGQAWPVRQPQPPLPAPGRRLM